MDNLRKILFIVCICKLCTVIAYAQSKEASNSLSDDSVPKISVNIYPENGGVANYYYSEENQEINFMALSSLGYKFVSWTKDGEIISDELYMKIPYIGNEEICITANFCYDPSLPKISIAVEPDNCGEVEYYYDEIGHKITFYISKCFLIIDLYLGQIMEW